MAAVVFSVPGEPVPFARAGANGKRRFTPKKQSDFMGTVQMYASQAMRGLALLDGPLSLTIEASYVVPASWSKKKRAAAVWKASKPDADNISKLVKDALNNVVWIDDAQVACLHVEKRYGERPGMVVRVEVAT